MTFLFLVTSGSSQTAISENVVLNLTIRYSPVNIEIIKDNEPVAFFEIRERLRIRGFEHGYYKFIITRRGQPQVWADSAFVQKGQALQLNVTFDGPCLYDHPEDYIPACPENHTDHIIPIVYGLIAKIGDSDDGKYLEGGCVVTDCDPNYYCKVHMISF